MDKFIKRNIWADLITHLQKKEVLILLGPRQVGKTTLILKLTDFLKEKLKIKEKYIFYYNFDDLDLKAKIKKDFFFIEKDITLKLGRKIAKEGEKIYLFIDEAQKAPSIFDLVKIFYDKNLNIKVILSGSSSLNIKDKTAETLAGRASYFFLYPLSFSEIIEKEFSFFKEIENIKNEKELKEIASFGFRKEKEYRFLLEKNLFLGSLPKVFLAEKEEAINYLNNFLSIYLDKEIKDVGAKIDFENFHLSFQYLAPYTADLFNFSKMAKDLGIKRDSLYHYLSLLEKTLVIKTVSPFIFPQIKNIFKSRKLFFFDNGVVNRLQGFFEFEEIKRTNFLGRLFESFIFQNLYQRCLNDIKKPSLYYFRDYQNHEIDLIYKRGNIVIPIETTYSFSIPPKKLTNFKRLFAFNSNIRYGLIFYLGEVKTFFINKTPIFAIPFFLV
jgi:predicted AAA+ superfamily ATPase